MTRTLAALRSLIRGGIVSFFVLTSAIVGYSQISVTNNPPFYGPFNARFFPMETASRSL